MKLTIRIRMNLRIIQLTFLFFFANSLTWGQNKKEQLERMKSTIDSMSNYLIFSNKRFEDSLFLERLKSAKQQEIIKDQMEQINLIQEQNEFLRFQNITLLEELNSLKKKLDEISFKKDSMDYSEKQYFTLLNDEPTLIHQSKEYREIIKDFKKRFLKYPENNLNEQFNVPSYSKLTEVEIWWEGNTSCALTVVKDVKMIIEAGNDAFPEISLTYYVLRFKNNQFEKEFSWQKKLDPCHLDSENSNIKFQITDLNKDGKFEIWCVNENYCKGGIQPSDLFIYLYQNGELYTMKSATNIPDFDINDEQIKEWTKDEEDPFLRINEFDSKFLSISNVYREYAIRLRNENILGETLRKIR